MKVDSNTKGNTYWFMFKVSNFRIGVRYTFNILNFTRSIDKFYNKEKMNIVLKQESNRIDLSELGISPQRSSDNSEMKNDWEYGLCENILFETSDIVRGKFGSAENPYFSYY